MQHISSILHSLGFVESEIKTYVASLEYGPGTVIDLTKLTKLSRQATYVAIETLTKRGLMSSVLKGKKRYYVSEDPEKLLAYGERKQQEMKEHLADLDRILPELKLKARGEHPVVKLFEGKEGMMSVIEDLKNSKESQVYEIVDIDALNALIDDKDLQELGDNLKKIDTNIKAFICGTPKNPSVISQRQQLPAKFKDLRGDIIVYGDKIGLMTFEGKMFSVVIESKALANTLRALFEVGFDSSKK